MEINSPSRRKYEQIVSNVSDEQAGSDQEQVRAYTCTFCQRGFSNAQALGGHMNIHRKDRAKLRQTEDESLPESSTDDQDTDCTLKRPSLTLSGEGTTSPPGMEKLHQLSLFSEKPSQGNDQSYGGGHEEKIIRRGHRGGNPSQKELDLELRLGPEPPSSREL